MKPKINTLPSHATHRTTTFLADHRHHKTHSNALLDFSDTAKQMAALKAVIFHVTETNETKIQFIKEELAAGKFQIQSDIIAARMLEYTRVTSTTEEAEIA